MPDQCGVKFVSCTSNTFEKVMRPFRWKKKLVTTKFDKKNCKKEKHLVGQEK
jgi:hypothetical protein